MTVADGWQAHRAETCQLPAPAGYHQVAGIGQRETPVRHLLQLAAVKTAPYLILFRRAYRPEATISPTAV